VRAVVFLAISIATKIIAMRMIKRGIHYKDECPAEDAIPKFLLGKRANCSLNFQFHSKSL